jgi:hypothetical protein
MRVPGLCTIRRTDMGMRCRRERDRCASTRIIKGKDAEEAGRRASEFVGREGGPPAFGDGRGATTARPATARKGVGESRSVRGRGRPGERAGRGSAGGDGRAGRGSRRSRRDGAVRAAREGVGAGTRGGRRRTAEAVGGEGGIRAGIRRSAVGHSGGRPGARGGVSTVRLLRRRRGNRSEGIEGGEGGCRRASAAQSAVCEHLTIRGTSGIVLDKDDQVASVMSDP